MQHPYVVLADDRLYTAIPHQIEPAIVLRWVLTNRLLICIEDGHPSHMSEDIEYLTTNAVVCFEVGELIWRRCGIWGVELTVRLSASSSPGTMSPAAKGLQGFRLYADQVATAQRWWRALEQCTDLSCRSSCNSVDTASVAQLSEPDEWPTSVQLNLSDSLDITRARKQAAEARAAVSSAATAEEPAHLRLATHDEAGAIVLTYEHLRELQMQSRVPLSRASSSSMSEYSDSDDKLMAAIQLIDTLRTTVDQLSSAVAEVGDVNLTVSCSQLQKSTVVAAAALNTVLQQRVLVLRTSRTMSATALPKYKLPPSTPQEVEEQPAELDATLVGAQASALGKLLLPKDAPDHSSLRVAVERVGSAM
ncbi:hypothetical protein RI367_000419 [Sorochytrium milnesiophthora]